MVYIWIEDKVSGKKFWDDLCNILFESKVSVESQKCAGDLVDIVRI